TEVPLNRDNKQSADKTERIEEELPPDLFPDIYDLSNLLIDPKLPFLQFKKFKDTLEVNAQIISVEVIVPSGIRNIDLFLFRNNRKIDMFYQIGAGVYKFNKVRLNEGENVIETFYRKGSKRSISVYSIINLTIREKDGKV
ncbi:MAG: hypothetical protein K8H86_05135, partial [Ignavibacteriaceae bacterium]|nr:hypothetical protein [Ignavibacteriaceae bacterium]